MYSLLYHIWKVAGAAFQNGARLAPQVGRLTAAGCVERLCSLTLRGKVAASPFETSEPARCRRAEPYEPELPKLALFYSASNRGSGSR